MKITRNLFLIIVVASQFCVASDKTGLNKPSQIIDNGSTVIVTNVEKSNEKEANWVPKRFDALDHFIEGLMMGNSYVTCPYTVIIFADAFKKIATNNDYSDYRNQMYLMLSGSELLALGSITVLLPWVVKKVCRFYRYVGRPFVPGMIVSEFNNQVFALESRFPGIIGRSGMACGLLWGLKCFSWKSVGISSDYLSDYIFKGLRKKKVKL